MMLLLAGVRSAGALDPHHLLTQYGRQSWGTENGLPQNTVHAIAQTRDGFLWVGTEDGLARFDGNEFRVLTVDTTPELGSSSVVGLTADASGKLWVVTTAGLAVGGSGGFRRLGMREGLPEGTVRFVHEDRQGRVWVATAGGLCTMREGRCAAVAGAQGTSVSRESGFAETAEGDVWLGDGSEAVRLAGGSLARLGSVKTVGGMAILAELVGQDGRLLAGTEDGLQGESNGSLRAIAIAGASGRVAVHTMVQGIDGTVWLGTSAGLARGVGGRFALVGTTGGEAVQSLFVDREGTVWGGTVRGIWRIVKGRVEQFKAGDTLGEATLLGMLEDREGNVWLGTEADGLTVLRGQKFTTYTTVEGLSGNVVRSVFEDAAGTVWVGTDGAGLNRFLGDRFEAMTTKDGLSSDVILALAGSGNGDVWVGTPTGLNRVRGRSVKVFTAADGLADDYVRSLLVDKRGDLWIGTRHGLTWMPGGNSAHMRTFTSLDGLGSDFIGVMMETSDGDLWIGTSGGLTRLHEGKFRNYTVRDGLTADVVTALLRSGPGGLWIGSDGSGLSRWAGVGAGAGVSRVDAHRLPPAVFGILEDGVGGLWVSSRSGIYRRRWVGGEPGEYEVTGYDTTDGMRVREGSSGGHPAATRTRDGRLWFATLRGVTVVDPEHLNENRVAPLVAIERVVVNDVVQEAKGDLVLAPGTQRVEFQYAGLSFVAPQKVMYRYRLEGFDKAWVEGGTSRAAFYTSLRPGRYVFHMAAANNDGVWSTQDATLVVRVKPFFWQTWWFYLLTALGLAGLAYWTYARRMRRVEARVGARYAGVMEERGRIAREIHDGLAQGIVSISLQLEVVTRLMGTSMDAARTQLEEAKSLVRQSLAEARSSIWALRAEDAGELPVRVGKTLQQLTETGRAQGRLKVTGSYRAIAREIEDELLRIAQEAMTNAMRHSGCSEIRVVLTYELSAIRLEVRDDGRGFDVAAGAAPGHFGLVGMRERVEKIGGTLEVRSVDGRGTEIAVELSLV